MYYMNLFMDSDCLIKLTKSGLKNLVEAHCTIIIPKIVEHEVVAEGKKKTCDDAYAVEKNISRGGIRIHDSDKKVMSGDDALTVLFAESATEAVATDDEKLVRRLRANGIPYLLPALIFYRLVSNRKIGIDKAKAAIDRLSEYISQDEYATTLILLEKIQ
jgi:rRNA-processing protein FCF1